MFGDLNKSIQRLFSLLFILVILSGCVSKKVEPEHKPRLGVAQTSDGWMTFRLETELGYKYQIQYKDPANNSWKTLADCDAIEGTGEPIEIRKRYNSRKPVPQFTVNYSKY
ncbi:MAG: hypothetical protein V3V05_07190 [Pontiella sp.]